MSKRTNVVHEDERGLYVLTGGYSFRPGGIPGYDHAFDMDDAGLKAGDRVLARHIAQTVLARITTCDSRPIQKIVYWAEDYCHERHNTQRRTPS